MKDIINLIKLWNKIEAGFNSGLFCLYSYSKREEKSNTNKG
jgi:hypothetical protein